MINIGINKLGNLSPNKWEILLERVLKNKPFKLFILDEKYLKVDNLDYLIFDGGADVTPLLYGETPHTTTRVNYARDYLEQTLFRIYYHKPTKYIGICRGMQFINVMMLGTLYQDLPSANKGHKHYHDINIIGETKLNKYIKNSKSILVNSLHHQAVKKLGVNLIPTMFSSNGIIEGFEYIGWDKIRAVQSHPEFLDTTYTYSYRILEYLFREPTNTTPKTTE